MDPIVTSLIAALKSGVPMLVRAAPPSGDYLEGVLSRPDLPRCYAVLSETLGPSMKEFGQAVKFERSIDRMVKNLGGIRLDQCLFLKSCADGTSVYAALWPWASDATRVTLKVGVSKQ